MLTFVYQTCNIPRAYNAFLASDGDETPTGLSDSSRIDSIYREKARKAQGVTDEMMPFVAPLGRGGSIGALTGCCIIAVFKNFNVFTPGSYGTWDYKNFITGYLGIPVYLILIFGCASCSFAHRSVDMPC